MWQWVTSLRGEACTSWGVSPELGSWDRPRGARSPLGVWSWQLCDPQPSTCLSLAGKPCPFRPGSPPLALCRARPRGRKQAS